MGKYNIDKLTRLIFPWFWQNDTNLSLTDTIQNGCFDTVNDSYEAKEIEVTARVGYSIQRLSLEKSLNDQFDPTLRRITITQGTSTDSGFVYNNAETISGSQEIYVYNGAESITEDKETYIFNQSEPAGSATAFEVNCPIVISSQEAEVRAWIDFVLISGTEYNLIFS